jgi:hypothetical protein
VATPTKVIQVSAYDAAGTESEKWELNTLIAKTTNLVVYSRGDAGQINHAFYFDSSGTAVAESLPTPPTQFSNINFVLDTFQSNIQFRSPDSCTPVFNNQHNTTVSSNITDFDLLLAAASPSGGYSRATTVGTNGLYSGWLDPTNNGWSTDDHFVKIKIVNVSGTAVTITTGYQPIGGLRWLISQ